MLHKKNTTIIFITLLTVLLCIFTLSACQSNRTSTSPSPSESISPSPSDSPGPTDEIYTITFLDAEGATFFTSDSDDEIIGPSNAPALTGYTFSGWYTDQAATQLFDFDSPVISNTTLYPGWTVNNYTLSFNSNGGSQVAPIEANFNTPISAPANPTKLEAVFDGWYTDPELTTLFVFNTMPIGTTLYAKWSINSYTITFDSNGGNAIAPINAEFGANINEPAAPINGEYNFIGWFIDSALTQRYTFNTMGSGDITLYADWDITPPSYLTYIPQEHGGTIYSYAVSFNKSYGSPVSTVNIPKYYNSLKVDVLLEFDNLVSLTTINIPDSIRYISQDAFYKCSNLTTINVNSNNQYFAVYNGILYNNNLTELVCCPEGLTECAGLSSTTTTIKENAFRRTALTELVLPLGVTELKSNAFRESALESITLNEGLINISSCAFYQCLAITSITLPSTIEYIESYAFSESSLTSIVLNSGLVEIGNYAFSQCASLTSISMPSTLEDIGEYAFENSGLTAVTLNDGLQTIGDNVFWDCAGITSITIPSSITSFGNGILGNCTSLASVTLGEGLTSLGQTMFHNCTSLTSIDIPSGVTSIPAGIFALTGLTSIILPEGITTIGNTAFNSTSLTEITIPEAVTSLGNQVFYGCSSLTTVYIMRSTWSNDSGTTAGTQLFDFCHSNLKIYVNSDSKEDYKGMTNWSAYSWRIYGQLSFTLIQGDTAYEVSRGDFENTITSVTVPATFKGLPVIRIANYGFSTCNSLSEIVLPATVTEIGDSAFSNSGFTAIDFLDNIISIGRYAFNESSLIESVNIPETLESIGTCAFLNCLSLGEFTVDPDSAYFSVQGKILFDKTYETLIQYPLALTDVSYTVPSTVKAIGSGAFAYSPTLTDIILPSGLTDIQDMAFMFLTELTSITLPNTLTTIGFSNFFQCDSLTALTFGTESIITELGATFLNGCDSITSISLPACITTLNNDSISYCELLSSVTFETGSLLASIGEDCFSHIAITTFTLPKGVTEIVYGAFCSNNQWSEFLFESESSLETIERWALLSNSSLKTITFPKSLVTYNGGYQSSSFEYVYFEENSLIETIGDRTFYSGTLKEIDLPEGLLTIGEYAFRNCQLTSLVIPSTVTTIGINAFYGLNLLTSLTFAEECSLTEISDYAFSGANNLTEIIIPEGITEISHAAFENATKVTNLVLPQSLITIGDYAFDAIGENGAGVTIRIPTAVTSIGEYAFYTNGNTQISKVIMEGAASTVFDNSFYPNNDDYNSGKMILVNPDQYSTYTSSWNSNMLNLVAPYRILSFVTNCDEELEDVYINSGYYLPTILNSITLTKPAHNNVNNYTYWCYDAALTQGIDSPSYMPDEDITVYVKWVRIMNLYAVYFDTDGGTEIDPAVCSGGNTIDVDDPVKEGYTFEGWYLEDTFETLYTFPNTMPTYDFTVYAKFVPEV